MVSNIKIKTIVGYPNYGISEDGRAWSRWNNVWRPLKGTKGKNGMLTVKLSRYGVQKTFHVHTLVAEYFIGPRPEGLEICHNDGDALNNHASNLRYGTSEENKQDSLRLGAFAQGEAYHRSDLTKEKVIEIRQKWKTGRYRQWQLAQEYGVVRETIKDIVNRVTWKHVI